jgi:hypothetical protein
MMCGGEATWPPPVVEVVHCLPDVDRLDVMTVFEGEADPPPVVLVAGLLTPVGEGVLDPGGAGEGADREAHPDARILT